MVTAGTGVDPGNPVTAVVTVTGLACGLKLVVAVRATAPEVSVSVAGAPCHR
ncbi:hypothetical protein SAMN05428934_10150 [Tessaracoccus flavus]|nr:hypothetical protein SAMN05428934_10150 [Tessaracoccus flavus]